MSTHLKRPLLVRLVGIVGLIFAVQANFVSPTSALPPVSFDVGDLTGEYGGLFTGKFGAADAASLIRIVADGEGKLTLEQRRNVGGVTECTGVRRCTYVIQPSGFGTITCDPFPDPPGLCVGSTNAATVDILLSDGGSQFDAFLEGPVLSGHFIRQ